MAHGVDDDVDADLVGGEAVLDRVAAVVDPLPGVAEVGVAGEEGDEAALLVLDAHVVGRHAALLGGHAALRVVDVRHLHDLLDVEVGVEDWVRERQLFNLVLGEDLLHLLPDVLPSASPQKSSKNMKPPRATYSRSRAASSSDSSM